EFKKHLEHNFLSDIKTGTSHGTPLERTVCERQCRLPYGRKKYHLHLPNCGEFSLRPDNLVFSGEKQKPWKLLEFYSNRCAGGKTSLLYSFTGRLQLDQCTKKLMIATENVENDTREDLQNKVGDKALDYFQNLELRRGICAETGAEKLYLSFEREVVPRDDEDEDPREDTEMVVDQLEAGRESTGSMINPLEDPEEK
ncbi:unnamed protein product, partial [Amoebophrya sp. A120]